LLLRFDKRSGSRKAKGSKTTLFTATFISYFLGLATTIFVMHTFQAAQPALLYLVPYCIAASSLAAVRNGQFTALLAYSEETKEEKPAQKASGKTDKKKQ